MGVTDICPAKGMWSRPPPPRPLRRKLRQEVFYSCPLCADPLLVYHHIIPWHVEQHFREEDMIALCCKHARMADANAISRQTLYNLKANPPRKKKIRDRFVIHDWNRFAISLGKGTTVFENCLTVLSVENQTVIGFTRQFGMPALFVDMTDDQRRTLLRIEENDWLVNLDELWDCEVRGNSVCVRDRSRRYHVAFRVDAAKGLVSLDFRVLCQGVVIQADKNGLRLGLSPAWVFSNILFRNCAIGFNIYRNASGNWAFDMAVPGT